MLKSANRICWLTVAAATVAMAAPRAAAAEACRILVVDQESGWPVPMVELKTTHQLRFVTDNSGVIAMDDPSLMNREVWFSILGHGYAVKPDGFGSRGVRLTPRPGETLTVTVQRSSIAKRIGRLTGAGLFAESQKLGAELDWQEGPVFGCDSVQNAVHRGKLFWAWGDTQVANYPLGIFHMTGATTSLRPFDSLQPPLRPRFDRFIDDNKPRPLASMPGSGPTWLTGVHSLPDKNGVERLVACYRKISPPLEVYEAGLCVWNDDAARFEHLRTVWKKSDGEPLPAVLAEGHSAIWTDDQNQRWLLFGNPLPHVRLPATFEAWQDVTQWQTLTPQRTLVSAVDGSEVEPHSGSIAWNEYRSRWVTVFMQKFGKPSAFGTLWYAEADSPLGPWGPAVEILSHENYTFYNPRLHPEVTATGEPILLFEGTYSAEFADRPVPTPRYDYNQILYRLDLDDPKLSAAAL
ncbi:MAG: hypothetical protein ACO1RT_18075 [Planctomycetaceae bacterium]